MERKIRLKTVNPCITCVLCKGYLIDATTITECLHTFCKACIVKYLEQHTECPQCNQLIHQSHPLNYISHDRTMQDIVYKLVPNLQLNEKETELQFYKKRGLPLPSSLSGPETPPSLINNENNNIKDPVAAKPSDNNNHNSSSRFPSALERQNSGNGTENVGGNQGGGGDGQDDGHRLDDQVNVCLQCSSTQQLKMLKRRFIRCSSQATITHLKKYIALKLYDDTQRYRDVEILCNEEPLGKDHTLKFITVTRWRAKNKPLALTYRQRTDL